MSFSLVLKFFCILVTSRAIQVTHTPRASAPTGTRQPLKTAAAIYIDIIQGMLPYAIALFWALGLTEIVTLLAPIVGTKLPEFMSTGEVNLQLTPVALIGTSLVVGGTLLRIKCYNTLKKFFTFEVTIQEGHKLMTSGPYSVVRHPSYSGLIAVYTGMICWYGFSGSYLRESRIMNTMIGDIVVGGLVLFYLGIAASLMKRMREEDVALRNTFGKDWEDWAAKVPCCIIPGIY